MEIFIRDYIEGFLDCIGTDIKEYHEQVDKVVKFICADDHWVDVLDNTILEACDRFGVPVRED